jgi:predicted RNA-binding Zn-ribbon protein involved in translation (DUF1610 family)
LVVHEETHVPISFECPHCGKKLKAPDGAVGKSSKCPGCGNAAICPEPIYDAEVVGGTGEEPLGLNSDANLGGDKPYGLIGPPAPAALPAESRRPCPMCGEMILAAAIKCRHCGEVFDPVLKKGKGRKSGKKSSRRGGSNPAAVRDLGLGVVLTVLGIGLTVASLANPIETSQGQAKSYVFYGLVIGGIGGMIRGIRGFMGSD